MIGYFTDIGLVTADRAANGCRDYSSENGYRLSAGRARHNGDAMVIDCISRGFRLFWTPWA